jgi:hypothetical protein
MSTENSESLKQLKAILKVLVMSNGPAIEKELAKIATTNDRKKMWMAITGTLMPKEIASQANVTQMAVSNFLAACKTAGLVEYNKGEPPKRLVDYVPPSWLELIRSSSEPTDEKKSAPDGVNPNESTK